MRGYMPLIRSIRLSSRFSSNYNTKNSIIFAKAPNSVHQTFEKRPLRTTKLGLAYSCIPSASLTRQLQTKGMATQTNGESSQEAHLVDMNSTANMQASYTSINPVEIYRQHIGELLAPIVGVKAEEIVSKLQWTQTQDKGDLMLAAPALRIKGKKPNEQAAEWGEKVCSMFDMVLCMLLNCLELVPRVRSCGEAYCFCQFSTILLQAYATDQDCDTSRSERKRPVWNQC